MDFLIRAGEQGYSASRRRNFRNRGNERLRYLQDPRHVLIRYSDNTEPILLPAQAYAARWYWRVSENAARRAARNLERASGVSGLPLMSQWASR